jgi:hypothetical protein
MPTKFSQFNAGGAVVAGDQVVGLRNGQNTIFNAPSLPTVAWTVLSAGSPLSVNNGYIFINAAPASFSLPLVATVGQIIQVYSYTAQICTISQGAGQQIQFGINASTLGIGGSIATTSIGNSLTLVCLVANTIFGVLGGPQGLWTIT